MLLVSDDLDELFALADSLFVIYRGRLGRARDPDATQIGRMMSGQAVT